MEELRIPGSIPEEAEGFDDEESFTTTMDPQETEETETTAPGVVVPEFNRSATREENETDDEYQQRMQLVGALEMIDAADATGETVSQTRRESVNRQIHDFLEEKRQRKMSESRSIQDTRKMMDLNVLKHVCYHCLLYTSDAADE